MYLCFPLHNDINFGWCYLGLPIIYRYISLKQKIFKYALAWPWNRWPGIWYRGQVFEILRYGSKIAKFGPWSRLIKFKSKFVLKWWFFGHNSVENYPNAIKFGRNGYVCKIDNLHIQNLYVNLKFKIFLIWIPQWNIFSNIYIQK